MSKDRREEEISPEEIEADQPLEESLAAGVQVQELELEDASGGGVNPGVLVALLVAIIATVAVVWTGAESETYFYTADKAVAQGSDIKGKVIRVKGIVEPGTVIGEDGELGRSFRVAEKGKSIKVYYDKALPDTFKEGMEVVAQGEIDDELTMQADEVVVKCPSRYEGGAPTEQGSGEPAPREQARGPGGSS